MKRIGIVACALACAGVANAQLQVSIGLRETAAGGGAEVAIGANGGSAGGIEFVNLDGQTLILDGTWQQFSFNLSTATYTAFAGTTANSVLDGAYGVLEMIRFRNAAGLTQELDIYVDDVSNTITPVGGAPTTFTFGHFEGAALGTEVIFQEPGFSGSTSGNLLAGSSSLVTDAFAHTGTQSDHMNFQFVDGDPARWVRVTTFNTPFVPNPLVRFDQSSVVTFWAMGVPEPGSVTALGFLGAAALLRRRIKK